MNELERAAEWDHKQSVIDDLRAKVGKAEAELSYLKSRHQQSGAERLEEIVSLHARIDDLEGWKDEARIILDGLQELGQALGLRLGESITGPAAIEAVESLKRSFIAWLVEALHYPLRCPVRRAAARRSPRPGRVLECLGRLGDHR